MVERNIWTVILLVYTEEHQNELLVAFYYIMIPWAHT